MGIIVGIDLGTTNSNIARLDDTGRPVMIENTNSSERRQSWRSKAQMFLWVNLPKRSRT